MTLDNVITCSGVFILWRFVLFKAQVSQVTQEGAWPAEKLGRGGGKAAENTQVDHKMPSTGLM